MTKNLRRTVRAAVRLRLGNPDQHERHCRRASAVPQHVVEFALVVADAGGHLGGHGLHGQDFDADIDDIADVERHVLHKEVIRHERLLAKLNFDSNPVPDKIGLIVGENRHLPCVHDGLFLCFW